MIRVECKELYISTDREVSKKILEKFKRTLFSWSNRSLRTLTERSEVLSVFAMSKIWYMAQILPLPGVWASKFEREIRQFLWRGHPIKNPIPLQTLSLPRTKGGLNTPNLRLECNALLTKQDLQLIS